MDGQTDQSGQHVGVMAKLSPMRGASDALSEEVTAFRPRARLLQLLGDQLIRSPRLAVFELVKNAYDADARRAQVSMHELGTPHASISVMDDGEGMSLDAVRDIWFVPGHDHKARKKERGETTRLGRAPIGEKGIGRFAAHKLGNRISVVTRADGEPEVVVEIDWDRLTATEYLSDAEAVIRTRRPEVFAGDSTGTRITVSELRDQTWTRGDLRRLYRDLVSVCSPFDAGGEFEVEIEIPGRSQEFSDIPDADEILRRAPWYFEFSFDGRSFEWSYAFRPPARLHRRIESRTKTSANNARLLIQYKDGKTDTTKSVADAAMLEGIGPISGKFYAFDRSPDILGQQSEKKLIKDYLDDNGGVRIYRDGIRVYNYGDDDDDWLNLDYRRFQTPTVKISRNNVLGAVSLGVPESAELVEKTNREGFVENDAFTRLVALVSGAFSILETERAIDKVAIRKTAGKSSDIEFDKIRDPISEIRKIATQKKVYAALEPSIQKLERNYDQLRGNDAPGWAVRARPSDGVPRDSVWRHVPPSPGQVRGWNRRNRRPGPGAGAAARRDFGPAPESGKGLAPDDRASRQDQASISDSLQYPSGRPRLAPPQRRAGGLHSKDKQPALRGRANELAGQCVLLAEGPVAVKTGGGVGIRHEGSTSGGPMTSNRVRG